MTMKIRFKTKLVLCIVSALLLSGCAKSAPQESDQDILTQQEESTSGAEEKLSSPGIVFEGQDIEGNAVSSSVFSESKLTMVNVWATYCGPCLREMPGLGELAGEYDAKEFQIIGIINDVLEGADQEQMELAKELIQQTGAAYPHLLLNKSLYFGLLSDVVAVPTTFFIDENGVVLDTVVGALDKSTWEEKINGLLEER